MTVAIIIIIIVLISTVICPACGIVFQGVRAWEESQSFCYLGGWEEENHFARPFNT